MKENCERKEIRISEEERDLGVLYDKDLKFRHHISNCINKANGITSLIRRTFLHVNVKQFRKLHKVLIRPHVEYCNSVWSPRFKKDIEAIERVQKRATKLVKCVRHLSYEERLKILKIPSLSYRRFRGDIIQTWKLLHGKEDIDYSIFFEKCDYHDHDVRGHSQKLKKKQCRKEIRKHFYSQRIVTPWNKLPDSVVNAPSLNTLKNRLDKFMGNRKYTVNPENSSWVSVQEGVIRDQ